MYKSISRFLKKMMTICALLLVGLIWVSPAQSTTAQRKHCSPQQAEAADAMVDHLDDWAKVEVAFKKFGQCDDGSIAEGYSEAVVRLLVDRWQTLPQLAQIVDRHPTMKRFVLRHIDTTVNTEDLKKIKQLSSSSCPQDMTRLCNDLNVTATHSLAVLKH